MTVLIPAFQNCAQKRQGRPGAFRKCRNMITVLSRDDAVLLAVHHHVAGFTAYGDHVAGMHMPYAQCIGVYWARALPCTLCGIVYTAHDFYVPAHGTEQYKHPTKYAHAAVHSPPMRWLATQNIVLKCQGLRGGKHQRVGGVRICKGCGLLFRASICTRVVHHPMHVHTPRMHPRGDAPCTYTPHTGHTILQCIDQ